jgi:hypothetical protein
MRATNLGQQKSSSKKANGAVDKSFVGWWVDKNWFGFFGSVILLFALGPSYSIYKMLLQHAMLWCDNM